ncbi:MAG: AAA family ATPase [Sporocytophaga sp.]|uniref:AAA family ATPase n=1 Tax=Sporocytophaga sp. TaxID=2231183 RepID=UPI001B1D9357|nr:AAA family ATPase [Sporocytophaga sp.]MBO9699319.1 AAA family ATPase [Sporocytophaga sp.]
MEFPSYGIVEEIQSDYSTVLYRVAVNSETFLLKALKSPSDQNSLARLRHEFAIANEISFPGVPRHIHLESTSALAGIFIEDIEGIRLSEFIKKVPIDLNSFFKISINICGLLDELHQRRVVHHAINPYNLFISPDTFDIKILNFSSSTHSKSKVANLNFVTGEARLEYISPEQSGRVQWKTDSRSDIYSLGVIFYEMLAGLNPFYSEDSMEIIHFHIAKSPRPLTKLKVEVPDILSSMIGKMISKNPEDRYQSASGIKDDLENCYEQLLNNGTIEVFPLCSTDYSSNFQISKKIYGRDAEIQQLEEAFDEVCAGRSGFIQVTGYSGVGKSLMIRQICTKVIDKRGCFIEGKFNQIQQNIPYYAFIIAFREFVDFILKEKHERLTQWKNIISMAVGANGKVLTEVVPNLELLIGVQPEVPSLTPAETLNRFNFVTRNFIKSIATEDSPLVIFIDDLQWADNASLELLKLLLSGKETNNLLIIGALRDNEVKEYHPLNKVVNEIKSSIPVRAIHIQNLSFDDVSCMINESFGITESQKNHLVDLVYNKTKGNAFFVHQFLKSLYEEKLLNFDFIKRQWELDIKGTEELNITDNVVDLVAARIQKLPEETQKVFKLAACLGNRFDLLLLSIICNKPEHDLAQDIQIGLIEDLVIPVERSYKFSHDKVQQAVYTLINEEERGKIHLQLGKVLLAHFSRDQVEEYIFDIANQFVSGIKALGSDQERKQAAELFVLAGKKAKRASAYSSSLDYLIRGIDLLSGNSWKESYDLSLALYSEAAESAYLCGNYDKMEHWIEHVLDNTEITLDQVKVYEIRIRAYTALSRVEEAVVTALKVLKILGVKFPDKPNKLHVVMDVLKVKAALGTKSLDSLWKNKKMNNPKVFAAIRIIASVASASYFSFPDLFPLFATKPFLLMVKHGNCEMSSYISVSYALIISGGFEDYATSKRLVRLASEQEKYFPPEQHKARVGMVSNTFLAHVGDHLKNTISPLEEAYKAGVQAGDFEYAAYSVLIQSINEFISGNKLRDSIGSMRERTRRIIQLQQTTPLCSHSLFAQAAQNLHDNPKDPLWLVGEFFDESKVNPYEEGSITKSSTFDYFICKLILSYFLCKYEEAYKYAIEAEKYVANSVGNPLVPSFYLYQSIAYLAVINGKSSKEQKGMFDRVLNNQKKLAKLSKSAPMNYLHKYYIIEAELNRVKGKNEKAHANYIKAISFARQYEYLHEEALALEMMGKFHLFRKEPVQGEFYIQKARESYYHWGAIAKVEELENKYPSFLKFGKTAGGHHSTMIEKEQASGDEIGFDLKSIMKASTAISGEINLERLLEKMIRIVLENAGAEKGLLVLKNEDEEFYIEAEGALSDPIVTVLKSIDFKESGLIPNSIFQYVLHTRDSLVIDNAVEDPKFSSDELIQEKKLKSVVCLPILKSGNLMGILYLENNLISNAFTPERIQFLQLLSGQMAVSIENALNEEKKIAAFRERENLLKKINIQQTILSKEVIKTQEYERKRIAEELHDGMGYLLSTLKLNLTAFKESGVDDRERYLESSLNLLEDAFKELKSISNNLMPDVLLQYGLVLAVDFVCKRITSTGKVTINFKSFNINRKFRTDFEIEVFRVVQELINNALKHSGAKNMDIQFVNQNDYLVVTVEDDGKGFNFEATIKSRKKGRGLNNIIARVNFLRGTVNFDSSERGTSVILSIPLKVKID